MVALTLVWLLQGDPLTEARRLLEQGERERAIALLSDARERSTSAPLLAFLARLQTESDQIPQAAATLAEALELRPEQHRLRTTLGALLFRLGRYDAARAELVRALEGDPKNGMTHYYLGAVAKVQGNYRAAREHAEQAVKLIPEEAPRPDTLEPSPSVNALYLLAEVRYLSGDNAETLLQRVTELDVTHPGAHYLLGQLMLRDGRHDEATKELELFRRTKKAAEHIELAVNASHHAENRALAVAELRLALQAYPDHPRALYLLGVELVRLGERMEAVQCLRRLITLSPDTRAAVEPILKRLEQIR
ncbi:MAG TPA: tetratricopeptide repeat protein [Vicinamibacteria bacterium]|nr:tetratricopeptide repeat protein [Vicinamibacteria bacterium]